jgi:hypothetical protein
MPQSQHCTEYFIEAFKQLWLFLMSNDGELCFASIATVRAIVYYLDRSRIAQAKDLAAAIVVATIIAIVIGASECRITKAVIEGLKCKHAGVASQDRGKARDAPFPDDNLIKVIESCVVSVSFS